MKITLQNVVFIVAGFVPGRLGEVGAARRYLRAAKTGGLQENKSNAKTVKQTNRTAIYGDDLSPIFQVGFNRNGTSLLGADARSAAP